MPPSQRRGRRSAMDDRRPTRSLIRSLFHCMHYTRPGGTVEFSAWQAEKIAEVLGAHGFIKPDDREPGWYRVVLPGDQNWRPSYWTGRRWGTREPATIGARIDMPDEPRAALGAP